MRGKEGPELNLSQRGSTGSEAERFENQEIGWEWW